MSIGIYRCLWEYINKRVCGYLCVFMGICEFVRIYESLWVAMAVGLRHR